MANCDFTMESTLQALMGACIGAISASAVGLVVGLALLEIPFSLALTVVLAITLVAMGLLIIFSPAVRGTGAVRNAPWVERLVVSLIAVFAVAGGAFAIALYLKLRNIEPVGRLVMFAIIGMALTIVIAVNVLDLAELIAACCRKNPARPDQYSYAPVRLLSRPAQIYTVVLTATILGLFVGALFGIICASEVTRANPLSPIPYNPWPAARKYVIYWLPVTASLGFLGLFVALSCLRPVPLPAVDGFDKSTSETYDARGVYMRAPVTEEGPPPRSDPERGVVARSR